MNDVVGRALATLPVKDLTVEDPPLEEVMSELFSRSRASTKPAASEERGLGERLARAPDDAARRASPRPSPTARRCSSGSSPPPCRSSCWRSGRAVAEDAPVRALRAPGAPSASSPTSSRSSSCASSSRRGRRGRSTSRCAQGMLSMRLLRPIHPLVAYAVENLADMPMRLVVTVPVAVRRSGAQRRRGAPLAPAAHLGWRGSCRCSAAG